MKLTKAFDEIIAYTYQADIYCPECVLEVMDYRPPQKSVSTEQYLNEIASDPIYPINRNDEYSFDSDIFPKVVFSSQLEDNFCGGCEVML